MFNNDLFRGEMFLKLWYFWFFCLLHHNYYLMSDSFRYTLTRHYHLYKDFKNYPTVGVLFDTAYCSSGHTELVNMLVITCTISSLSLHFSSFYCVYHSNLETLTKTRLFCSNIYFFLAIEIFIQLTVINIFLSCQWLF